MRHLALLLLLAACGTAPAPAKDVVVVIDAPEYQGLKPDVVSDNGVVGAQPLGCEGHSISYALHFPDWASAEAANIRLVYVDDAGAVPYLGDVGPDLKAYRSRHGDTTRAVRLGYVFGDQLAHTDGLRLDEIEWCDDRGSIGEMIID